MAGPIRHPINLQSLESYLTQHVPSIQVPLDLRQFGFGQSNPTYQLTSRRTGQRYVLRKKPPGKLLSKAAHKVEREHRIITVLNGTAVPVPRTYCLCEDSSVIGTPFYIMEFIPGRIFEDLSIPEVSAGERTALWREAVHTLARLHAVDYGAIGLASFGRSSSEDFYDRQLATWTSIQSSQAAAINQRTGERVGPIPHFDSMARFFADKTLRPKERACLVHGDYKLDNMVFHPTPPRIIGLLDWEMSTIGHPLSDLANMLGPWYTAAAKPGYFQDEAFAPGATPGLPTPETVLGWYAETAGWDPGLEIGWAVAFSVFRSAAICQGIAARRAMGQASSGEAGRYADAFGGLGEVAWGLVRREMGQVRGEAKP